MNPSELKDQKVVVMGFARSGIAVAKRLASAGAKVVITESRPRDCFDVDNLEKMDSLGVRLEFGGHSAGVLKGACLLVLSPGVHLDSPVVRSAGELGIPVVSEIEIAFSMISCPVIAVTGTNGKTTTCVLIGEMLARAGFKTAVAGNIGHPLSAVDDCGLDFIVAEVSSYQLETIKAFRPRVSVILNITEDHLERHGSMEAYASAKSRIFLNQKGEDYFVYNSDDPRVKGLVSSCPARRIPFSRKGPAEGGVFARSGALVSCIGGIESKIIEAGNIGIRGEHNLENALGACACALVSGAKPSAVAEVLREFEGVEHRIEFVRALEGVEFFNDSKATNPDSSIVAMRTLGNGIVLIAGGRDKGGDLSSMVRESRGRIKGLVLIGEAADRFEKAFSSEKGVRIARAKGMPEAVRKSFDLAGRGDRVLLSPACSSFDMFRDYEDRGLAFKRAVSELRGK